jgi:hypothetical protein
MFVKPAIDPVFPVFFVEIDDKRTPQVLPLWQDLASAMAFTWHGSQAAVQNSQRLAGINQAR